MLGNAPVVADFEAGRIHKTDPTTLPKTALEIDTQGHQGGGYPINEALIARQAWKFATPVATDMLLVKMLEISIRLLMETHQNRHDFTETHRASSTTTLQPVPKQRRLPLGFKDLAEIINVTEKFL